MSRDPSSPADLLAVEVGSSRIKLGWIAAAGACDQPPTESGLPIAPPKLPVWTEVTAIAHRNREDSAWQSEVEQWLGALQIDPPTCVVAAVDPAVGDRLIEGVLERATHNLRRLTSADIAMETRLERPDLVGVDRLINAAAARRVVGAATPVLVIDAGTAITIDLTSGQGVFEGGAILPGPHTAAAALSQATLRLPQIEVERHRAPSPVGRSTEEAIAAGIYWGTVGAIRQVVDRTTADLSEPPVVLLTGGDAPWLATPLTAALPGLRMVEHLTLSGMAILTAEDA